MRRQEGTGKEKRVFFGKAGVAVDIPDHAGREGSTPGQRPASGFEREKTPERLCGTWLFERVFVLPTYSIGTCLV